MKKDIVLLKGIGKTILTFILFYYSSLFQLIPIMLFNIDLENLSGSMNVMLSAFSSCCLLFVLFFMYRNDINKEWNIFKKDWIDHLDFGAR